MILMLSIVLSGEKIVNEYDELFCEIYLLPKFLHVEQKIHSDVFQF